jgi:hypothetical protein
VEEEVATAENSGDFPVGAVIASAVVAGLTAFLLRRALGGENEDDARQVAAQASRSGEGALRERAATATGELVRSYLLPELKPVLLTVLSEVKGSVDRAFQRAEQVIAGL